MEIRLLRTRGGVSAVVLLHPHEQKRSSGTPVRTMPKHQNRCMGHPAPGAERIAAVYA
ncbi:hypothetical protein RBB79_13905 [Tunturiibacter empetritectus]|uniref:Uncharacterized protein n=2 Tax=Tunturiibacter TaxID=3154218 RepID=A0A852VHN6_9BACT|nr:hypothetical protein [Edaphobacter lichenicola]NYF90701.1 hypothetical protein [Edaphobacter lichenicola]